MEEHKELLRACYQLLKKQDQTCYVINIHSQTVSLDCETEVDGLSLQEHIKEYLENNEVNPEEFDNGEVNV